jgi:hypothetical protein
VFEELDRYSFGALVQRTTGDALGWCSASSTVDSFADLECVWNIPDDCFVGVSITRRGINSDGAGERSTSLDIGLGRNRKGVKQSCKGDRTSHFDAFKNERKV